MGFLGECLTRFPDPPINLDSCNIVSHDHRRRIIIDLVLLHTKSIACRDDSTYVYIISISYLLPFAWHKHVKCHGQMRCKSKNLDQSIAPSSNIDQGLFVFSDVNCTNLWNAGRFFIFIVSTSYSYDSITFAIHLSLSAAYSTAYIRLTTVTQFNKL